jgi:diacylglycerol kinase
MQEIRGHPLKGQKKDLPAFATFVFILHHLLIWGFAVRLCPTQHTI